MPGQRSRHEFIERGLPPLESRPLTPSGPGQRGEVVAREDAAAETGQSRGASPQGPEGPTLRRSEPTASGEPLYPGAEADAQPSWGPEFEVNIPLSEQRQLTRESWD